MKGAAGTSFYQCPAGDATAVHFYVCLLLSWESRVLTDIAKRNMQIFFKSIKIKLGRNFPPV
ncbi:hypothetical protein DM790_17145 [Flavobacterium collinsii]|nr:hypothetical protein [Flavobacterium collinsii]